METLGIVVLVLLAVFFGGCALTALFFMDLDARQFGLIALVAAALTVVCIMAIRSLRRSGAEADVPNPPPNDGDGPAV